MGAPKGNQFWKLRSKHGRDKLFADPLALWEAACEYFDWVDKHPFQKKDWKVVGKSLEPVYIPYPRPYTMEGLCLYLGCGHAYFREFKSNLPKNAEAFLTVIEEIEQTCYNNKLEGAASGHFNANIVARVLGLADKKEIKGNLNLSETPIEFE